MAKWATRGVGAGSDGAIVAGVVSALTSAVPVVAGGVGAVLRTRRFAVAFDRLGFTSGNVAPAVTAEISVVGVDVATGAVVASAESVSVVTVAARVVLGTV